MAGQIHRKASKTEHNGAAEFREELREIKNRGNDLLHDTIDEFKQRGADLKSMATEYVQEKPLHALGAAALVGLALSFLIRR